MPWTLPTSASSPFLGDGTTNDAPVGLPTRLEPSSSARLVAFTSRVFLFDVGAVVFGRG
jgi:hypothetical protein